MCKPCSWSCTGFGKLFPSLALVVNRCMATVATTLTLSHAKRWWRPHSHLPLSPTCKHSPQVCCQVRDCTTEDATAYAAFLNHAAASLHSAPGGPYTLSVDVASWSVFWDWDAIAATDIDRVMVMVTHTTHHMPHAASLFVALALCDYIV